VVRRCMASAGGRQDAPLDVVVASTLLNQHLGARVDVHASRASAQAVGAGEAQREAHLQRLQACIIIINIRKTHMMERSWNRQEARLSLKSDWYDE